MNASREPLLTSGAVVAIVAAFLVFMEQMGLPINADQQDAARNLVAVLAPLVLAGIARQLVVSPASAHDLATDSATTGTADPNGVIP
jgi:hypothetical protein